MFQNYIQVKPIKGLELTAGGMTSRFENFINYGTPYGSEKKSFNIYLEGNYTSSLELAGSHSHLTGFALA